MNNKDNASQIGKQINNAAFNLVKNEPILIRTANMCMEDAAKQPPIRNLWGTLFQSNEVVFLSGDTGVGKTLLAVAIANAISNGSSELLGLTIEQQLPVLFIDIELSDRQFYKRYESYHFHNNFYRAVINPYADNEEITISIEHISESIKKVQARVLILDNITALSLKSTVDVDVALIIMRGLKKISMEGISIIVLTHIPKQSRPEFLRTDHLAGSKYLSFFADSILFIAQSSEAADYRYIKQTKCRNAELMKDVMVLNLCKTDNFLGFEFVKFDSEANHIGGYRSSKEELKEKAQELKKQGKSIREIAGELGISKSTVDRMLNSGKAVEITPKEQICPTGTNGTDMNNRETAHIDLHIT